MHILGLNIFFKLKVNEKQNHPRLVPKMYVILLWNQKQQFWRIFPLHISIETRLSISKKHCIAIYMTWDVQTAFIVYLSFIIINILLKNKSKY